MDLPPSPPSASMPCITRNSCRILQLSPLILLAAGFDNSYIKLWSIQKTEIRAPLLDKFRICLACDTLEEEENEDYNTDTEMKILQGHCGPVYSTWFLADSSGLLSRSEDMTIRYWNLGSFTNTVLYQGHTYTVWDLDISPYSRYFASGYHDCITRLWHFDQMYPLRIYAGHLADVDCVKFHPNSNYMAIASTDKTGVLPSRGTQCYSNRSQSRHAFPLLFSQW